MSIIVDDLTALEINSVDRRILAAEKARELVALDPKTARRLLEPAIAKAEKQQRRNMW